MILSRSKSIRTRPDQYIPIRFSQIGPDWQSNTDAIRIFCIEYIPIHSRRIGLYWCGLVCIGIGLYWWLNTDRMYLNTDSIQTNSFTTYWFVFVCISQYRLVWVYCWLNTDRMYLNTDSIQTNPFTTYWFVFVCISQYRLV